MFTALKEFFLGGRAATLAAQQRRHAERSALAHEALAEEHTVLAAHNAALAAMYQERVARLTVAQPLPLKAAAA